MRHGTPCRIAGDVVGWDASTVCKRLERLSESKRREQEAVDLGAEL